MPSHSSYRQTWWFRGLMDEYLVVRRAEVHSNEELRQIPANDVRLHLRGWRGNSMAERTLLDIYEALGGQVRPGMFAYERLFFMKQLWAELEEAFETGRLALLRVPRPVLISIQPEKSKEKNWKEKDWEDESEPMSWVGLQLEDEEGEPVAGQRVRIKLPDGVVRERVSDDKGRIRMDSIPVGTCQVEFPGLDAADWKAV